MNLAISLLTLLHLLIPIYWLGGDLGAFYCGGVLRDSSRPDAERLSALKVLLAVDMAPRTALILTLPTGFTLAWAKGWLAVPSLAVLSVWLVGLGWLALAWAVHLRHGPAGAQLKRIDLVVRYVVLVGLIGAAMAGLTGAFALPLFICLKLIALATCIMLGLLIRLQLTPLFPAIAQMRAGGATPDSDRAIARVIAKTRPTVLCLWAVILVACFLGIAIPR